MSDHGTALRVYRSLLRLYPREFRDAYGPDMALLFRDQCDDEPTGRVITRALLDLALTAPARHLEVHVRRNATTVVSLVYLAIAAAGVAIATAGGSNRASLVMGLSMALIGGTLGLVGRRRTAPVTTDGGSGWWKLLLAGPLLIGLVLVASGLGVQAWFLGIATVLVAITLVAAGVVLGIVRLLSRRGQIGVGGSAP